MTKSELEQIIEYDAHFDAFVLIYAGEVILLGADTFTAAIDEASYIVDQFNIFM